MSSLSSMSSMSDEAPVFLGTHSPSFDLKLGLEPLELTLNVSDRQLRAWSSAIQGNREHTFTSALPH